jgi:hypothetical protein
MTNLNHHNQMATAGASTALKASVAPCPTAGASWLALLICKPFALLCMVREVANDPPGLAHICMLLIITLCVVMIGHGPNAKSRPHCKGVHLDT